MALRFLWNPRKAAPNLRKHDVGFGEATTAFDDPLSVTIVDPDHSTDEQRFLLLGLGESIRIISARRANRRERRIYEEEN